MLKIIEIANFDIPFGDREVIQGITSIEEARAIVQGRLINEGDHANYNPANGTLIIKGVGGPGENRCLEYTNHPTYFFWATHGAIH